MRIAMIGAGGIGGMLAARLGTAGNEVSVLARGAHLAAIRADGLTLRTPKEEVSVRPVVATDAGVQLPAADLVVVAVKAQDLDAAMDQMAGAMGAGAVALPFLNGVEATERLAARFGRDRVLTGVARISAFIEGPGVVRQVTPHALYTIGGPDGRQDGARVAAIREVFRAAGISVPDCEDVRVDLWQKFALLAPFSAVTAAARCDAATIVATPELERLFLDLAEEVTLVGRAHGVDLPATLPAEVLASVRKLPGEMRASLAHDLAAGKRLEIDWLSGAVPRLGARVGVSAPANAALAAVLAPWREGARAEGA